MIALIPLITGSGGAIAVLVLWLAMVITGRLHTEREFSKLNEENVSLREENMQLRAALDAERRSASDVARAGAVTNQLISALTEIAAERKNPAPAMARELGM